MVTKKEVIKYLIQEVESLIPMPVLKRSIKGTSVTFLMESECRIVFLFDTVMGGSQGKDSFVITFSMALHNPFFAQVRKGAFGVEDTNPITKDLVLSLNYLSSLPKDWKVYERYKFSDSTDRLMVATRLLQDIDNYYIPYIKPFLGDYKSLLDFYKTPELVRNFGNWWQFITGVIAAILTNQEDKIEDLIVPLAKQNTNRIEFLEFKKAGDYHLELVEPIKMYIRNNGVI